MSHLRPYLHPTYVEPSILPHSKMSTTPTVTTSAVRDLTLGDEFEIANHIHILVATQGNGTPFNPTPSMRRTQVKLCMAHQEGMLWLSDTEMVFAFCSCSDMMTMTHLFAVAMVWCVEGEPQPELYLDVRELNDAQLRETLAEGGRGWYPSWVTLGQGGRSLQVMAKLTWTMGKQASEGERIGT